MYQKASKTSLLLLITFFVGLLSTSALAEDWVNLSDYFKELNTGRYDNVLMDFDSVKPVEEQNGFTFDTLWKSKEGQADIKAEFQTKRGETVQYCARAEGESWTKWGEATSGTLALNMELLARTIYQKGKQAAKDVLTEEKKHSQDKEETEAPK